VSLPACISRWVACVTVPIDYRSVRREDILPKSSSSNSAKTSADAGETTRKPCLFSVSPESPLLTRHSGPLQDLFRIYPKAEKIFRNIIRAANLVDGIKAPEFQFKKERILILRHLITSINGLDTDQIRTLADAVLIIRRDMPTIMNLLKVAAEGPMDKGCGSGSLFTGNAAEECFTSPLGGQISEPKKEETPWGGAHSFGSLVSDSAFLKQLKTASLDGSLRDAAVDAEETAYACLRTEVESLVARFRQQVLLMQKGECDKQIQREISREEERDLGRLRADFVDHIEDLTRQRSGSYVLCQCILK
jgi:hypothetical protein